MPETLPTRSDITPADFTRIKRDLSRLLGAISGPVPAYVSVEDRREICLTIAGIIRVSADVLTDAGFDTSAVDDLVDEVEEPIEPAGCPAR